MSNAIRLTNQTAKALRKNAVRIRTLHYAAVTVISVCMAVFAVVWGLKWLPGVAVTVVSAVLLNTLIVLHGRSVYLSMIAQAICTEAAAREIRAGTSEAVRRERAISDLISANADTQRANPGKKKKAVPHETNAFSDALKQRTLTAQEFFYGSEEETDTEDEKLKALKEKDEEKEEEKDEERYEEKYEETESEQAKHRRRRKEGLTLIRSEQAN